MKKTKLTQVMKRNASLKCGNFFRRMAKSLLCNASLAYHGGTSPILQHLKRKHLVENPIKPPDKQRQTKLDVFSKKRVCSTERAGAISDRIANFIIKDLRSINIVSGQDFKSLWRFLSPDIVCHQTHTSCI